MVFFIWDIRGKETGRIFFSFEFHAAASQNPRQKTRSSSSRIKY